MRSPAFYRGGWHFYPVSAAPLCHPDRSGRSFLSLAHASAGRAAEGSRLVHIPISIDENRATLMLTRLQWHRLQPVLTSLALSPPH